MAGGRPRRAPPPGAPPPPKGGASGPPPGGGRPSALAPPAGEAHERIRLALRRSALFWHDLLSETGLEAEPALAALWDLVWAGEATNDAWTPLRAERRYGVPRQDRRRPRRFDRRRSAAITATQGRWTILHTSVSGSDPGTGAAGTGPDRRGPPGPLL